MPMYEYRCETCAETIEILQHSDEPDRRTCGEDCACDVLTMRGTGAVVRVEFSVTGGHVMGASRPASAGKAEPYCGACGQNREPCG